jgi:hypothetical protein
METSAGASPGHGFGNVALRRGTDDVAHFGRNRKETRSRAASRVHATQLLPRGVVRTREAAFGRSKLRRSRSGGGQHQQRKRNPNRVKPQWREDGN